MHALIVLLSAVAAASELYSPEFEESEDAEASLTSLLQLSLRPRISSEGPVGGPDALGSVYADWGLSCHKEYTFPLIFAGMLGIGILFLGLGRLGKYAGQVPAGQAHLDSKEPLKDAQKGSTPPAHLGAIDGLRAIFTVMIIIAHASQHFIPSSGLITYPFFPEPSAYMQFFFVVSGFVNVKAIERQRTRFDWIAGLLFILKRCCRLFPMYWLGMLLMAGKYKFLKQDWGLCPAGRWFTESIGIHSWFGILSYNMPWCCVGSTPSWFVSALLPMTLCFPMLYNILPSREGTTSCLILMIIFVRSTYFLLPPLKTSRFVDFQSPYPHFPEFFVGMLCAVWCRQVLPHIPSWSGWACLFDASLLLAYLVIVARNSGTPPSGDYGLTCFFCIMCVSASAMAESPFPRFWPRQGLVGHILNCGPLQFLARYAYSIYILQWPVLALSQDFLPRWAFDRFAAVPLAILFGICADVVIDQPIQRVLDRYLRDAAK